MAGLFSDNLIILEFCTAAFENGCFMHEYEIRLNNDNVCFHYSDLFKQIDVSNLNINFSKI